MTQPHARRARAGKMRQPRTIASPPSSSSRPMYPLSTASKIVSSVKRSFSPSSQKKRHSQSATPTHDDDPTFMPSPYRRDNVEYTPPSIEQIAMGLHISRTPHLRPLNSSPPQSGQCSPHSPSLPQSRPTSASSNQRAFPARSSLKKSTTVTSSSLMSHSTSASLSTATSNTLSTPRSGRSLSSLKARMPWFSMGFRASPPDSAPSRNNSSHANVKHMPRKKAVRFTGHTPRQEDVD
ncbi:hypothetical protein APHAL10511_004322 [Amanita phalloides]|nr:hypothetical protein APHAL10511_004322 [Amanita phalloides]